MQLPLMLLLLLIYNTQANQFLGTVMTYYPETPNADGSVTVGLRYKLNFQSCTDLRWQCLTGNCGNESVVVNNVSMDSAGDWCQTEGISTRQVPTNAPFQLWLNGSSWIDNITNGIVSWRAVTLVELRNRSDTNQANASPETTILPAVRIPSNCPRDFSLLAFDPDGDNVQCRNGNTSLSECSPCTPPSVLSLSSSCTLSFNPTNSSNEGPYAVQLVMEDFPRQTIALTETNGAQTTLTTNDAISKIPVQFVLWVDPVVPSCTEGLYLPQFLPPTPTNGAQLYTPVNQSLEINIKADANISTVSELLFSGPYNVIQNTSGAGQFTLTWTPSQSEDGESFPICFVVKAVFNTTTYQSNLRCIIVSVGSNSTISTTVSTNSSPTSTSPQPINGTNTSSPNITDTSTTPSTAPPPINGTGTTPNITDTNTTTSTSPPPINGTNTSSPNITDTNTTTSTFPPPINGTNTSSPNITDTSITTSTSPPINGTNTSSPNITDTSTTTSTFPPPINGTNTSSPNITDTNTTTSTFPPPINGTNTSSPNITDTSITTSTSPPINGTGTTPNITDTSTVTPAPFNDTTTPSPNTIGTTTVTPAPPPPTNTTVIPTPRSTTSTPSTSTPTTQMTNSPAYVVGLSVQVSSLVPLSTNNIVSALQQVQNTLVNLGMPSDITIRLVSFVQK